MNKNSYATIREVYEISVRLEEKLDKLSDRISNIEGRASIFSLIISAVISMIFGIFGIRR